MTTGPERMGETLIGSDRFGRFDWSDPWPTYDRLRAEAPHWVNPEGATILTRYADCEAVLRDARFSSSNDHADPPFIRAEGDPRALMDGEAAPLIFLDPPDHTRLRKLVNKALHASVGRAAATPGAGGRRRHPRPGR